MFNSFQKILVLAPHTDDGELGCGGTIARFIEEEKTVYYIAFSSAEKSVPKCFPKDILRKEVKKATNVLGVLSKNLILFDYPVREFPRYRQEILEDMVKLKKKIRPDLVLLPSSFDTHQDHQVISQEGFRAFKAVSMLGYEIPYNNLTFNTNSFVLLHKKHIEKKIKAMQYYKSQSQRTWVSKEFIKSLAITRGRQIKTNLYAESFELIRWII
jgi:LmbE family N-acetylglucosaminyl deacetylase